jgi:hypothetical protein
LLIEGQARYGTTAMTSRRYRTRRAVQRTRQTIFRRRLSLEEPGGDELDEWMVACPAGESPQASS